MALAVGASRRQIFASVLIEAGVLGLSACIAGLLAGFLLARVLIERTGAAYEILPVTTGTAVVVSAEHVVVAATGGIIVSLVGALLPARRVLDVAPVESLRAEAAYEWGKTASFGVGRRTGDVVAVTGIVAAVAMFAVYVLGPQRSWLPLAGVVVGMTGVTFLLPRIVPIAVRLLRPVVARPFGTVGRLAADALGKNPGRTTFTVAALVLTLGMVVGVGSALASYQAEVEAKATALIGAPLYVTAESYRGLTSDQPLPARLERELEAVRGVRFVYPLRFSLITLGSRQALMYAIPVAEALRAGADTELSAITRDPHGFLQGLAAGGIAISRTTAEHRDLEVGDRMPIPTPRGAQSFRIAAVFDDLLEFDSLYIDHATYVKRWDDRKADEFGVLLDDDAGVNDVKERIGALLDATGAPARVYTKEELLGRILEIVEGTFSLGRAIQLAALVVALITIANTMLIAVLERRWEIGLQRALGMSDRQLRASVLLEAAGIGLIGGIGGMLLGAVAGALMTTAMEVQFAWHIPFQPPVSLLLLAIATGTGVAATAGVVPSRLVARSRIVESLRYE